MPFIRCPECDWVFDAARQTCPLCGRCAICGTTMQQLAKQGKGRRKDPARVLPRSCEHAADEPPVLAAAKVPEREVAKYQRRFGARRRKAQRETIVAMIIGTLFGSPAAFFVLPKIGLTLLDFVFSLLCGAVLGYVVNRVIRYLRPGGLDAPAAEFRLQEGRDLAEYAELLDEFGIELGLPRLHSRTIEYASDLSLPQPATRSGTHADERRLVFGFGPDKVHRFDQELLRRAGLAVSNDDMLLLCIPHALEKQLIKIESEQALGDVARVGKTVFGVRRVRGENLFYVIEQTSEPAALLMSQG